MEELPPEVLDWKPGSEMNSLSVLIVHLTGAERYWVGDVVKRDASARDRNAEFRVSEWTAAMLKQRIMEVETYEKYAACSPTDE